MSEEDWGQMLEEQEKQQQEQQLSSKVLKQKIMVITLKFYVPVLQITVSYCHAHTYLSMQLQSSLHVKDSPAPAAEPSDSAQPGNNSSTHDLFIVTVLDQHTVASCILYSTELKVKLI